MWAFAREHSAKQCMRRCYEDVNAKTSTASEYSKELKERFAKEKLYQQFVDSILNTAGEDAEQSKVIVL